ILQTWDGFDPEVSVKPPPRASSGLRGFRNLTKQGFDATDELRLGDPVDLDDLARRAVPGGDPHRPPRQPQRLREERLERVVRAAVLRGRRDLDLQLIAEPADDLVP